MAASWFLELELEARIGIATVRSAVQLSVLGYILEPIFGLKKPAQVAAVFVGVAVFMLRVVVFEATARLSYTYTGIRNHLLFALAGGLSFNLTIAVLIVDPTPLWSPRYIVPLFGMLLGASCTACCLALGELMNGLHGQAGDNIEFLLANGASCHEATKVIRKTAVSTGIIPTLNTMNIIGLVSIPGMMTGQMLGGASPTEAARYQMLIMFVISSCACTSVLICVSLCLRTVLDSDDVLRRDLLIPKERSEDFVVQACWCCSTLLYRCFLYIRRLFTHAKPGAQDYEECPEQSASMSIDLEDATEIATNTFESSNTLRQPQHVPVTEEKIHWALPLK